MTWNTIRYWFCYSNIKLNHSGLVLYPPPDWIVFVLWGRVWYELPNSFDWNTFCSVRGYKKPLKNIQGHQKNTVLLTVTAWENASTGNNTPYDNIQPRQRGSPNTGCSTKASPDLNEGPNPTYLIGRSSFLTEIPAAEGGQRMLLAYKLCTRASSEECSNIGALEKSTRCNGHFLLFPSFLYVFLSCSLSPAHSFSSVLCSRASPTPFADWRGWNNPLWQLIVR